MNALRSAASLMLAAAVLTGCGSSPIVAQDVVVPDGSTSTPAPESPDAGAAGWTKIAPWPYAPWSNALTAWTGTELLVFGAPQQSPYGGPAPELNTDRAAGAYDPAANRWRKIARAPFSQYEAAIATAGNKAYALSFDMSSGGALTKARLWRYDVESDGWRRLADPPAIVTNLAVAGGTLAAWVDFPGSKSPSVQLYDIAANTWRSAPANPWVGFQDRQIVGLPDGRLVVLEAPPYAHPIPEDVQPPSLMWRAAVLDVGADAWRRLPPSGIATGRITGGSPDWALVAGRLVNADPRTVATAKGAGLHLGRLPLGGVLDVDAARWEPLPKLPGTPHERLEAPKGEPQPEQDWTTRDFLRVSGGDYALAYAGRTTPGRTRGPSWSTSPATGTACRTRPGCGRTTGCCSGRTRRSRSHRTATATASSAPTRAGPGGRDPRRTASELRGHPRHHPAGAVRPRTSADGADLGGDHVEVDGQREPAHECVLGHARRLVDRLPRSAGAVGDLALVRRRQQGRRGGAGDDR